MKQGKTKQKGTGVEVAAGAIKELAPLDAFGYGFATAQNPSWTMEQVLLATGGRHLQGTLCGAFRSVVTDSRQVQPGDLFVALVGDKFDGHAFLGEAVKKGAAGLLLSQPPAQPLPVAVFVVESTERALGDLAAFRRARMVNLQVLAITGSSGKTTVKEMTAAILGQRHRIIKTKGNFNNQSGLPLSLLPVSYRHRFAILELGMNHPGEIARLTEIADPDIACIVNIQAAHLEGLGSVTGVAKAKGELFAGLNSRGTMVVNCDDRRVRALAKTRVGPRITFGCRAGAQVRATYIRNLGSRGMSYTLTIGGEQARVRIAALGAHNVGNSLAAAAMAHGAGIGLTEIAAGLAAFRPEARRGQLELLANGLQVLNDCYNANPSSMLAGLTTAAALKERGKSVAILGDMLELGEGSEAAHAETGQAVARLGFDYLLAVGHWAPTVVAAARSQGLAPERALAFADKASLLASLRGLLARGQLAAGDLLLVKGSRGMGLETIIEALAG